MIAQIRGTVLGRDAATLIVDLHGLGLRVHCTPSALAKAQVGVEVTLPTSLVIREDHWQLFGFHDHAERDAFLLLQSVSGIGPRIALAAVSTLEPDRLSAAIASGDVALLTRIPGIGRKGAERMCVELRDRITSVAVPGWEAAVRDALTGLGWSTAQADAAVASVAEQDGTPEVADALRAALQILGRR